MSGNVVYEKLCDCFQNINDWLKYAEAKNGILFAFNGATIIGLLTMYKDLPSTIKVPLIWFFVPSLLISLFLSLISFVPILDKWFKFSTEKKSVTPDTLNLFYFGDLRKLSETLYLKLLYDSLESNNPVKFTKLEKDLAQQILINSAITYSKFTIFKICVYLNLLGFFLSIIFLLIKLGCAL